MELGGGLKTKEFERPSIQTQHLTELVCPVCYEYMHPPIMLCEQGHSICALCHELMSTCPLCQGRLTFRRSSTLEALTAVINFPCKHCNKRFRLEDLDNHNCFQDSENDHSPLATCIVGQVYGDCTWNGPINEMSSHCLRNHPEQFWTEMENFTTWNSNSSNIGVQNIFIVKLKNALFVIIQKFDSNNLSWNLSCECSNNDRFEYQIHFILENGNEKFFSKTQIDNAFNIMSFFPSSNEIVAPVDKISSHLSEDNILRYKIVIKNRDYNPDSITSSRNASVFDENTEKIEKTNCFQKAWISVVSFYSSIKKILHL